MKDICEGRRTKNDVVEESIRLYREVFIKANREVDVLIQVKLFHAWLILDLPKIPSGELRYRSCGVISSCNGGSREFSFQFQRRAAKVFEKSYLS